jgi:hypothetical protein
MILYITQAPIENKIGGANRTTNIAQSSDFRSTIETTSDFVQKIEHENEAEQTHIPKAVNSLKTSSKSYEREFKGFSDAYGASKIMQKPEHDDEANRVLRIHFSIHILKDLERLQNECGRPTAAIYADNILRTIRAMRDKSPFDSSIEFFMALYDAMAYQNKWLSYNQRQYIELYSIIKRLVNKVSIRDADVEKSILALEKSGFDTLPYEVNIDFDIDDGIDVDNED